MATRAVPQQSILDCLPTAVKIADLRVVNKDLNFIQANILIPLRCLILKKIKSLF